MGFGQIFKDFSGWTSAHGIPLIGAAQNFILRIFWTIVLIGCTIIFGYQLVLLVQRYLAFGVIVNIEIKFEERFFPAVTICNLNPYKHTQINLAPRIATLTNDYKEAIEGTADPATDTWGFTRYNDTIAMQNRARDHLVYLASDLKQNNPVILDNITYERDDFIVNCLYNTKACDMENDDSHIIPGSYLHGLLPIAAIFGELYTRGYRRTFTVHEDEKIMDPVYGSCYAFNSDVPPTYLSTRAGPYYGLQLLLKVNKSEYLPMTDTAGVKVSVHKQGEEPFPDAFGYNAGTGFTTSFGIKFVRTLRLPSPYGNCTEGKGTGSFYYDGEYSEEACLRSCFQDYIRTNCSCSDPRYATPTEDNYCTDLDVDCVASFASTQNGISGYNPNQICSCPQPCNESTYGVTVSTANWPSDVYTPYECKDLTSSSWSSVEECHAWYMENTLFIEVYYDRMNYQLLSETPEYSVVQLISDTGGQLGLWMGISVVTVVEFGSLLILMCLYCMARREGPGFDGEPDDDEDENQDDTDLPSKEDTSNDSPPPSNDNENEDS